MKFKDVFTSGFLMKTVYILRNDCLNLTLSFKFSQREVRFIGFRVRINEIISVIIEESFCMPHEE